MFKKMFNAGVKAHKCSKRCSWIQLYAAGGARWSGGRREQLYDVTAHHCFKCWRCLENEPLRIKRRRKERLQAEERVGEEGLRWGRHLCHVRAHECLWGFSWTCGEDLNWLKIKAKRGKPLKQTVFSSKEVRLRFVNDNLSCIPIANHKQCYSLKFT